MMNVAERTRVSATEAAQSWFVPFAAALQAQNAAAAAEMFLSDGLWRDVLAFPSRLSGLVFVDRVHGVDSSVF